VKFLKNKGIVIVLAVFAVGLVFKNLVWPFVSRRSPAPAARIAKMTEQVPSAPSPAAPVSANAAENSGARPPRATLISLPSTMKDHSSQIPMDIHAMRASAPAWAESPRRDPFYVRGGIKDGKSAREQLTLMGTLQQTRSTLAVVNNQVLSAGDMILGFKIESVDENKVWVSGPNGRESIEFKYSVIPPVEMPQAGSPQAKLSISEGSKAVR
jgi:hypothetical protein